MLDRLLITDQQHLRPLLGEYAACYNLHRPHRALQQGPPAGRPYRLSLGANIRVLRRDQLGGLIHEYSQVAYGDTIFGIHSTWWVSSSMGALSYSVRTTGSSGALWLIVIGGRL